MLIFFPQEKAKGQLFVDDGHSFDYQSGKFLLRDFNFNSNVFSSK